MKASLVRVCRSLLNAWNRFFFSKIPISNVCWTRRTLAAILFVFVGIRMLDFNWIFSDRGMLPPHSLLALTPEFYRPAFMIAPFNETLALIENIVLMMAFGLQILGIGERWLGGRPLAILVWFLFISLAERNFLILYGADYVACAWLFYLMFIRTDGRPDIVSSSAYRLLQLQVCVVYGYGGLEKFRGESWWDGSALWKSLSNPIYASMDFSWLAHFSWLIAFAAFMTAAWETYFPVVVWSPRHRGWFLVGGVLLHIGIGVMMDLGFFSALMVATYFLFLAPLPDPSQQFRLWYARVRN